MRRVLSATLVVAAMLTAAVDARATETVWSGAIHLERKWIVPAGETLRIQPGTQIRLVPAHGAHLEIHGRLIAAGTPAQPITFQPTVPGHWGNIRFLGKDAQGILAHCTLVEGRIQCRGGSPSILYCRIVDQGATPGYGILCEQGAAPLIVGNHLVHQGKGPEAAACAGILVFDSRPTISGNIFGGYRVGIQVARGGVHRPVIGGNLSRDAALIVLDENTPARLGLKRVLNDRRVGFVTSMHPAQRGGRSVVNVHTWRGIHRLEHSGKDGFRLTTVQRQENPDSVAPGESKGLVAQGTLTLDKGHEFRVFAVPTARSQRERLERAGGREDLLVIYDRHAAIGTVKWVSENASWRRVFVVDADVDGDGRDELITAWNASRPPHGGVRVYSLSDAPAAYGPANIPKDHIPVDLPPAMRVQVLRLYSPDPATRLEAITILATMRPAEQVVPFLVGMLADDDKAATDKRRERWLSWEARQGVAGIGAPAVGPLLEATRSEDPQMTDLARSALSKIKDPAAVGPLVEALGSRHRSVRLSAIRALGYMRDARAMPPLVPLLKDGDDAIKEETRKALRRIIRGNRRDPPTATHLLAMLKHDDASVRGAAASLVSDRYLTGNAEVRKQLIQLLATDPDASVRAAAAEKLGRFTGQAGTKALTAALKDKAPRVCWEAARQLTRTRDKRGLPVLGECLREGERGARLNAVNVLRWVEGRDVVDLLIPALKDEDPEIRALAAALVSRKRDTRAVGPLLDAMHDKRLTLEQTAEALGHIGRYSPKVLIKLLKDPDVAQRRLAVRSLTTEKHYISSYYDAPHLVDVLIGTLKDTDAEVRKLSTVALGFLHDPVSVRPLVAALRDPKRGVGAEAAAALGAIRSVGAVEPLVAALKDKDPGVRTHAAVALGGIGDEDAVPALIDAVSAKDEALREAAAAALRHISGQPYGASPPNWQTWWATVERPTETVEQLTAQLDHPRGDVRGRAIAVLSRMKDPRVVDILIERYRNIKGGGHEGKHVYQRSRYWVDDLPHLRRALVRLGEPAVEKLIRTAGSGWTSRAEVNIILEVRDASVPYLLETLAKGPPGAAEGAARVLARLRPPEAVIPLLRAILVRSQFMRASEIPHRGRNAGALPALMAYDPSALGAFQQAWHETTLSKYSRRVAAMMLAHFGDMTGWKTLEDVMARGPRSEVNELCGHMGTLRNSVFLPLFEKALGRKDAVTGAVRAAALCAGEDAVPLLNRSLKHPSPHIRAEAARWLKRLADER